MYDDDDEILEVAAGGGLGGIVAMTYWDSYVLSGSNYAVDISEEDQLSFIGTASTTGQNTIIGGSLWIFNDGTLPLPSEDVRFLLPQLGAGGTFNGDGLQVGYLKGVITSPFDPATITTLAQLEAIAPTSSGIGVVEGTGRNISGTKSFSVTRANLFTGAEDTLYGVALYPRHGTFFTDTDTTSITFDMGNKNLRILT